MPFVDNTKESRPRPRYTTANGKLVASVTTILGRIYAKPALTNWAWKLGRSGITMDENRITTADAGNVAHELIAAWLQGREPDLHWWAPAALPGGYAAFANAQEWCSRHTIQTIEIEQPRVSEVHAYGGTPDLYAIVDGRREVIDWKTSTNVYTENFLQLAGYRAMLVEAQKPVDALRVVILGREFATQFPFDEVADTPEMLERCWRCFWDCRDLYRWTQTKEPFPVP